MSSASSRAERPWVVLKYGGTSVATASRWEQVAERARRLLPERRVWIVASAVAGVSNALERGVQEALIDDPSNTVASLRRDHERLAREMGLDAADLAPVEELWSALQSWLTGIHLTAEAPPRLIARVMAVGELVSTRLGAAALARQGLPVRWVDARELLRSAPRPQQSEHQRYLEAEVPAQSRPGDGAEAAGGHPLVLTQGFIASTPEGETCLLGRGGSDTSGALFAALLDATELEIWTDVHGLFTADPHLVPTARLIRRLGYREAQELAAMGAKVLHPRCLEPVAARGIPLSIHCAEDPEKEGTLIEAAVRDHPAVTAVTCRTGVTLLSLSTLAMWGASGFLARVFAPFEELGISIDLVATSQSTITLTLDRLPGGVNGTFFGRLIERLEQISRVEVVHPCAVVSIVGRRIRAALHELGPAMSVFQERPVHLVSDSAEDLNLSFVVDEQDAQALVSKLHGHLFTAQGGDPRFGPTWEFLGGRTASAVPRSWWRGERQRLLGEVRDGRARYVYHLPTVKEKVRQLVEAIPSADRFYYSMKANSHPRILETVAELGFGLECVSAAEIARAREVAGKGTPLLFTPNFCPMDEYGAAVEAGAEVVVDGPEPLSLAPGLFAGLPIGARVDPGRGLGHHDKVRTAGSQAKFGHPVEEMALVRAAAERVGARVVGLHAHVGSGILEAGAWASTGALLASLLPEFGAVEWIDVGGGLGIPERPGQPPLDLAALERGIAGLKRSLGRIALRFEPGRYVVSEAGVLVAPVTQVRRKGGVNFVGLATGMNSLLRPPLYGAWHPMHNLTRLDEPPSAYWHVVGPICESADVLGRDRLLPETRPGDVVLIENAGAYGAVMASRYNLREPAAEVVLD